MGVDWSVQDLLDRKERGEMNRADALEEIETVFKSHRRNGRKAAFMRSLSP